jgi:CheY-like chemotaxis protein
MLLGYARKGKYEVKAVDLNGLVQEATETFGRTRKEVSIHWQLAQDLHGIEADYGQIEQVLLNLFVNAAEAMREGGDLFLKTANVTHNDIEGEFYKAKPGNYVLLRVSDTGCGMDEETRERVFEPFFTTKEMGRGTGLGLASVYGIVKAHGGYIELDSEVGQGTTFKIYFPACGRGSDQVPESHDHLVRGNATVLLVDDEDSIRDVGSELLRAMGYQVLLAENGKQGVAVYEKHSDSIAIVLLDIVMPEMGGGEAYDRFREIKPDVKVLLMSGYSVDDQASEILQRGCNGFIQKPFSMAFLSKKIREVLDNP